MTQFTERWQVPLYVLAMVVGAGLGWLVPPAGDALRPAVTPVLALLLYVTFLGMPLRSLAPGLREHRFLWCVLAVDVVLAPAVVLPVALAVSGGSELVPLAVVTQTLVELVVMVVLVAVVPRLVPMREP